MAVEAQVLEDVDRDYITVDGKDYELIFVKDGPSTHEDYLRFLKFQEKRKNDKERKNS